VFVGVVFLLVGLAGLIHPRVKMPSKRQDVWVGNQELKIDMQRIITVPTSVGVLAMIAGAGLIFLGVQEPR
jgi:hypothetical protein